MSIEGSLGDFRLQEILQAVAQQRRTGILTIQSETTIVAVSFLAGGVVSADSLAHTLEERLGDALVEEGLVDPVAVRELTRRQDAGEGRLVDLLVSDGLLAREEVLEALRRQNHSLLLELLDWSEGEFKFYGGDEVAYEEGIEPIAIDDFLLAQLGDEEEAGVDDAPPAVEGWADLPAEPDPGGWSEDELAANGSFPDPDPTSDPSSGPVRPFGGPIGDGPRTVAPGERPVAPPATAEPAVRRATKSVRRPTVESGEPAAAATSGRTIAPWLAAAMVTSLLVAAVIAPAAILLPFPWQDGDRRAAAEVRRLADRLAVDRAAKTFFLLEGRFPDGLDPLIELGLLDGEDRSGAAGERLELIAGEESYDVVAAGVDQPLWSEAITGNFLLDPELRGDGRRVGQSVEAPLVLLD